MMTRLFFYLHLAGICLLTTGIYLLLQPEGLVQYLMWISVCIGLGLLLVSPYPVVKAIAWMKNNG